MNTDPRRAGGGIAGPGGPHEHSTVVLDTRRAVLMETVNVAQIDNPSDGRRFVGLELGGRINQSSERANILYLFDADGAAALVTQLVGLAARSDAPWAKEFPKLVDERLAELP